MRRSSKLARPYICRLSILILVTVPSTFPLLQGEAETVGDGFLVTADAVGEGAELGEVAGFHGGEPCLKFLLACPAGHDRGEGPRVACEGVQVRAASQDVGELVLAGGGEAVGAGEEPAGDMAGRRDDRSGRRRGGHRARHAFRQPNRDLPPLTLSHNHQIRARAQN